MQLADAVTRQREQQITRDGMDPADWSRWQRIEFIRTQALGLLAEIGEVLSECGWKPWKSEGYGRIKRTQYLAEVADVIVFALNLAVAVDASGDELEAFLAGAQNKNAKRIKEGY